MIMVTWTGDENYVPGKGRVKPGQNVIFFNDAAAESYIKQGLAKRTKQETPETKSHRKEGKDKK